MTEYSPRLSRAYTPRYAEMDDDGVVTPVAMMGLFEETAVAHCDEAGWDVYRLRQEGYGWMMLEGGIALSQGALPAFDARALDIDTNGHVNNVRYLEWALEALPRDFRDAHRLVSIEGRFANQVLLGQRVYPAARQEGDRYRLAVYAGASDGLDGASLAACASSRWAARG